MGGTHLARWTLAWFASALALLVLALILAPVLAPAPGDWRRGSGLALVHLIALGWLGQAMIGALIQFLPVLLARPLLWPGLSLPALALCGSGALLLAAGVAGLEGWPAAAALLPWAPLLSGLGFAMLLVMAGGALIGARGWRDDTGRMVILALAGLALAWLAGTGMARLLAGVDGPLWLPAQALPLHIGAGMGGWLGLAAMGVSWRLFAMFLLSPDPGGWLRRATALSGAAMIAALAAGIGLVAWGGPALPAAMLAALAALAAAILYLADLSRLWRSRNRPLPEVNMQISRHASGFLLLAVLLVPLALWRGGVLAEAAIFAALIGWLSTLTLAQMVKITSFLTWIQVFAPHLGRGRLPLVQDLVDENAARRWLWLWLAGAWLGSAALLAGHGSGFRVALLLLAVAALGLVRQIWLIRRLAHLQPGQRPAPPRLILPQPEQP